MAWYDRFLGREPTITQVDEEKENPSQYLIARDEGFDIGSREVVTNYRNAYEQLEVVNRAVNMICLLYTSPSPRDGLLSRMPSSA